MPMKEWERTNILKCLEPKHEIRKISTDPAIFLKPKCLPIKSHFNHFHLRRSMRTNPSIITGSHCIKIIASP